MDELPAQDVWFPFPVFTDVPTEEIGCAGRGFLGQMKKVHMHLVQIMAAFVMVTGRAGSHHVRPGVLPSLVPGLYMVQGQVTVPAAAVLAGIIVAAKDLPTGEFYPRPGSMDLFFQTDDRRPGEQLRDRADVAAAIHDHTSFARKDQTDGPPCGTNVNRLKICVEHQDRHVH